MKTISIPLNNRPHYSERMFESLAGNDLRDWDLILYSEPFRNAADKHYVSKKVKDFGYACKSVSLIVNPVQFGVYLNSFNAHYLSFKSGSEVNLFIEDDIIVSPDITKMADWYNRFTDFPKNVSVVAMFGHINTRIGQDENLDPRKLCRPQFVCYQKGLGTFALIMTRKNWIEFGQPNFFKDHRGWDFSLSHHIRDTENLRALAPLYCRANHIGATGTHCVPEHQKQYEDILLYGGPRVDRFEMIHDLSTLKARVARLP